MAVADVAVVFPVAGPAGGVERVAAEYLRFSAARRATAFVGTRLATDAPVHHVAVTPRWAPGALRPAAFRSAARRVLDGVQAGTTVSFGVECPPGDVLWVHSVHAAWVRRGGAARVGGLAVPSAARLLLPRHRALLALERSYFDDRRPRAVLCTSPQEVADLAEHYDVPAALTHVVPNGYDPAVFDVARRAALRPSARERLGAAAADVVVLLVANEWHRKGLGVLLDAVARAGDPRLRVDLVGHRRPDTYLARARRLGVRAHWHGGSEDVAPFYAAADVAVLPSTYEPFGIVAVEAMAMGLPVAVSALAGASAAVTDGVDGVVLADPRDAGELAAVLRRLTDPDLRGALGAAAARAVAPYRWDQVLARADAVVTG